MAFGAAAACYYWFNSAPPPEPESQFASFVDNRELYEPDGVESVTSYPPMDAAVPYSTMMPGTYPIPKPTRALKLKYNFSPSGRISSRYYTAYISHDVPIYAHANNEYNLRATMDLRVLKCTIMSGPEQETAWRSVGIHLLRDIAAQGYYVPPWEDMVYEWLNGYSSDKYLRMLRATEDMKGVNPQNDWVYQSSMFVKDEVLMKHKPRPIINVNPIVQAMVGPLLIGVARNMKDYFNRPDRYVYDNGTMTIYIRYCSSSTDEELTSMRRVSDELLRGLQVSEYEFDFSTYDRSQSTGALKAEFRFLQSFGLSKKDTDILWRMFTANIRVGKVDVLLGLISEPLRTTGGPDTTPGNGSSSILSHFEVICRLVRSYLQYRRIIVVLMVAGDDTHLLVGTSGGPPLDAVRFVEEYTHEMATLGFTITGGNVPLGSGSFLKGLWYPTEEGLVWGPTPSRILKIGKALKDLRLTTKTTRGMTYCERVAAHAASVANGYASMLQVPLIRGYVERWAGPVSLFSDPDAKYKTSSTGRYANTAIDEVATYNMLASRYGEDHDWVGLEQIYRTCDLFTHIRHPIFHALHVVDY